MPSSPDKPPPLEYEAPGPSGESPVSVVGAVLGVILALLAAFFLYYGIAGILWVIRDWEKVDAHDLFVVGMFTCIGGISGVFAVRWLRNAFRRSDGAAGT